MAKKKNVKQRGYRPPRWPDVHISARPSSFHPSLMDYCDPERCKDYNKVACGHNRKQFVFQWFQSVCHIILNNKCSYYRGLLKFYPVKVEYCKVYVMYSLRDGCPQECPNVEHPVCAVHIDDNTPVVFKSRCELYAANCKHKLQQYVEVDKSVCLNDANLLIEALSDMADEELNQYDDEDVGSFENGQKKYYID
nr:unnamed protein product [Amyelois transitella]